MKTMLAILILCTLYSCGDKALYQHYVNSYPDSDVYYIPSEIGNNLIIIGYDGIHYVDLFKDFKTKIFKYNCIATENKSIDDNSLMSKITNDFISNHGSKFSFKIAEVNGNYRHIVLIDENRSIFYYLYNEDQLLHKCIITTLQESNGISFIKEKS